jgi:hypothetical protein
VPVVLAADATGADIANTPTLGELFRRYGPSYRAAHSLPLSQLKVLSAIETCRTAALGGHREDCAHCGFVRYAYNSCRNRHCPQCQSLVKAQWLEERRAELLPVPYFHTVFTLPHQLNGLIGCREHNQRHLLNLLMHSAAQTLLQFGRSELGGTLGVTMVLHTWDQLLQPHFHVHCLVPGGALATDQTRWQPSHPRFLFSVHALSKVFRGLFLGGLQQLYDRGQLVFPGPLQTLATGATFADFGHDLAKRAWVVYCQPPFAGPDKLLDYLGHYVQRVAISNHRLLSMDNGLIRFHYRDRRDGDRQKVACVPAHEFIRRFLCHTLPRGFQRIRHYGLFAQRFKQANLQRCRELLQVPPPPPLPAKTTAQWILELFDRDIDACPQCGQHALERRLLLPPPRARRAASPPPPAPADGPGPRPRAPPEVPP